MKRDDGRLTPDLEICAVPLLVMQLEKMMTKDVLFHEHDGGGGGGGGVRCDVGGEDRLAGPEIRDPYRCPMSTPAETRRQSMKQHGYVTFTNINRSVYNPTNLPSHELNYALLNNRRIETKLQKKNFDCYFVQDVARSAHADTQAGSTWLSSLCSQPVDEIFVKYKRRAEASMLSAGSGRTRHVSTKGEKALVTAWSCNASQRAPSSMSRSTLSARSTAETPTSGASNTELLFPSLRVYGYDQDPDKQVITPRFGLGPASTAANTEAVNANYNARQETPPPTRQCTSPQSPRETIDISVPAHYYDQYQRDRRFPEAQARRPPRSFGSPRVKRCNSDLHQQSTSPPKLDLEKSNIEIIPLGQLLSHSRIELANKYNCGCVSKDAVQLSPQIQGKG